MENYYNSYNLCNKVGDLRFKKVIHSKKAKIMYILLTSIKILFQILNEVGFVISKDQKHFHHKLIY